MKGNIAVRWVFSLIGSGVEEQISEITIFKYLLHIPVARCLIHSRRENVCFWLIISRRYFSPVYPIPKIPKFTVIKTMGITFSYLSLREIFLVSERWDQDTHKKLWLKEYTIFAYLVYLTWIVLLMFGFINVVKKDMSPPLDILGLRDKHIFITTVMEHIQFCILIGNDLLFTFNHNFKSVLYSRHSDSRNIFQMEI